MEPCKILIVGELILDTTTPVCLPIHVRTVHRRIEPIVYEQLQSPITTLGGIYYLGRFLNKFSKVFTIYPRPNEDYQARLDELFTELEKEDCEELISPEWVPVPRRIYEVKRFVEVEEVEKGSHEWAGGHALVRLDSGDIEPMDPRQVKSIAKKFEDVLKNNELSCIVLSDYDLGLFSSFFIKRISQILTKLAPSVPIVVYAGRKWQKFSDLDNCYIVSETSEAIEELFTMEGIDNNAQNQPFFHIAARFSNLKGFILVDGKKTRIATWVKNRNGSIDLKHIIEQVENGKIRTPVGHRALITSYLALNIATNKDPLKNVLLCHEAARYNGAVLIDKFSLKDASTLLNKTSKNPKIIKQTIKIGEVFHEKILNNNHILRLEKARTVLPGYYTLDANLKDLLKKTLDNIVENKLEKCKINENEKDEGQYFQKLMLVGPPGSGKSEIAYKIQDILKQPRDVLNLSNSIPSEPDEAVKFIKKYILNNKSKVIFLDETNNIKGNGEAVQRQLLESFSKKAVKKEGDGRDYRLIITANSLSGEDELKKCPSGNIADFYSRFPDFIPIPPLSERPFDQIYIFAAKLEELRFQNISLRGLVAVAEYRFRDVRAILRKAEEVAEYCQKNNCSFANDDAFDHVKLSTKIKVENNRCVTVIK